MNQRTGSGVIALGLVIVVAACGTDQPAEQAIADPAATEQVSGDAAGAAPASEPAATAPAARGTVGSGAGCVLVSTSRHHGEVTTTRDCYENVSLSRSDFREFCDGWAQVGAGMTGQVYAGVEMLSSSVQLV